MAKRVTQMQRIGGPAFPVPQGAQHPGMSLWHWYFGKALEAACVSGRMRSTPTETVALAKGIADAAIRVEPPR